MEEQKKNIIQQYTESKDTWSEKVWIFVFRIFGAVMFVAAIWEALYTLFNVNKEVVPISKYQVYFATVGFVLAFGGKSFGIFANNIGAIFSEKLKVLLGGK